WGVVFLLVTNGKSRWHSGDFLLFFAGASCHDCHPAIALFILIFLLFYLKIKRKEQFIGNSVLFTKIICKFVPRSKKLAMIMVSDTIIMA
ncbi:MAG: hypothetical protein ACI4CB_06430, partial [Prevotella sp.]